MSDITLNDLTQQIGNDPQQQMYALRTLAKLVAAPILKSGQSQDLTDGELVFETDFPGPWQSNIIALTFTKIDGVEVPNADPKDYRIAMVLGGVEFPFIEELADTHTGIVITDHIKLAAGDQIKVYAKGLSGFAKCEIRGEQL